MQNNHTEEVKKLIKKGFYLSGPADLFFKGSVWKNKKTGKGIIIQDLGFFEAEDIIKEIKKEECKGKRVEHEQ